MKTKKIVTIGGGTGGFALLSGLKKYPIDITAIVCMTDDGGSAGVLRDELGVLPPGDVRQCLVALSESSKIMRLMMNYRFTQGGLKGHTFGNIFLSALEKTAGGFAAGVEEAREILKIKGEVIPVTEDDARIYIKLKNGKIIKGEHEMDENEEMKEVGVQKIYLQPQPKAYSKALQKIKQADFIVIGPADYYTGILANLLVSGVSEAINKSHAKVIYNCNLTNKKGQTGGFDLDDYVDNLNGYLGSERIDYVLFNDEKPPLNLIRRYEKQEGKDMFVKFNKNKKIDRSYQVVELDLLNNQILVKDKADRIASTRSFIRHDSNKLAKALMKIINK